MYFVHPNKKKKKKYAVKCILYTNFAVLKLMHYENWNKWFWKDW